ncbi:MAG: glutamate--tRNA ligase [Bacteroidota bacterium]
MTERPVRVRYAPSPTGPQHLGGVRTALYNYLFARKHNGTFIIRIEDTDQTRFVPGAEAYMLDALNWCGITYDEGPVKGGSYGPYKQSERKSMYRQYADQLLESGHAYYAFDTAEELDAMRERFKASGMAAAAYNAVTREYMKNSLVLPQDEVKARLEQGEPYVIRIKMPRKDEIKFHDLIRGWVTFNSSQLDDKVLFKSDGMPTYHLANVVDDYLMNISHVIRGEEWLPSAPLHVTLYKFLGWESVMPQFAHLPLILRPDGNGK